MLFANLHVDFLISVYFRINRNFATNFAAKPNVEMFRIYFCDQTSTFLDSSSV